MKRSELTNWIVTNLQSDNGRWDKPETFTSGLLYKLGYSDHVSPLIYGTMQNILDDVILSANNEDDAKYIIDMLIEHWAVKFEDEE